MKASGAGMRIPARAWVINAAALPGWEPAERLLTPDELARARSYKSERRGLQYASAHLEVRVLAGEALGMPPERLGIEGIVGPPGIGPRPRLIADGEEVPFSMSRSGDLLALSIAPFQTGVDVEAARPLEQAFLRGDCFSAGERAAIASSPDPQEAGMRIWVRKEAVLKATGFGLLYPLGDLDVAADGPFVVGGRGWEVRDVDAGLAGVFCSVAFPEGEGPVEAATIRAPLRP